ncbi:hypothetical protein ACHAXS_004529 [Conticribra weissflogii]
MDPSFTDEQNRVVPPSFDNVDGYIDAMDDAHQMIPSRHDALISASQPSIIGGRRETRRSRGRKHRCIYGSADGHHSASVSVGDGNEDPWDFYDLTAGYVKRGVVVIPVDMSLPTREEKKDLEIDEGDATKPLISSENDGSNEGYACSTEELERDDNHSFDSNAMKHITREAESKLSEDRETIVKPECKNLWQKAKQATPSFSIKQSRVSLYAAFPPPTIKLPRSTRGDGRLFYDNSELSEAEQTLKRFSGFHGAVGVTSATLHREGYSDVILSCNYRWPSLLSVPSLSSASSLFRLKKRTAAARRYERESNEWFVGDIHCNLHLGSNNKTCMGGTLSTLDGRSHCRLDVGNPFHHVITPHKRHPVPVEAAKGGIISPSLQSDCTLSACRDFSLVSTIPMRLIFAMKYAALPLPIFYSASDNPNFNLAPLRLRNFSISLCNLIDAKFDRGVPKLTLSLSHGLPEIGGERFWLSQSAPGVGSPDHSKEVELSTIGGMDVALKRLPAHARSLSLKFDVKQQLLPSQQCQSFIQYSHVDRSLSIGSMITRAFLSSPFSKAAVGIRHTFGGIFQNGFHFVKGKSGWRQGVTWLLFQLERGDVRLLIPVTIRPYPATSWDSFLQLFYSSLTTVVVDAIIAELFCGVSNSVYAKFSRLFKGKEFSGAKSYRDDVLDQNQDITISRRQQAENARDEAIRQRNVMERQAKISVKKEERQEGLVIIKAIYGVMDSESHEWVGDRRLCTMDATAQIQFWVQDSSVHLPAVSKKHMLGFFDVMSGLKAEDWPRNKSVTDDNEETYGMTPALKNLRYSMRSSRFEEKRELIVVLTVSYKYAGVIFEVMYYDDEAVDLPSSNAKVVTK